MITDALIAALRAELAGYLRRGLAERAKAVEAELARLGFSAGATPPEVVQSESGSTPTIPAKRTRKPVEPPKPAEEPKTAPARKKPKK